MISKKIIFLCAGFLASFNALHGMDSEAGNTPAFEKIKESLLFAKAGLDSCQTKAADCRHYGYNGTLITIVKHPEIIRGGYIIEGAQPSMWWGYWYADSCKPENRIFIEHNSFIEDNSVKYEAKIKERTVDADTKIYSSCLVPHGAKDIMAHTIAILWEEAKYNPGEWNWEDIPQAFLKKKLFITMARLAEIEEQGNILDLDKNKVEVNL